MSITPNNSFEVFLEKKSRGRSRIAIARPWSLRMFKINEGSQILEYYEKDILKGFVSLKGVTIGEIYPSEADGKKYPFVVEDSNEKLLLNAPSDGIRKTCIFILSHASSSKDWFLQIANPTSSQNQNSHTYIDEGDEISSPPPESEEDNRLSTPRSTTSSPEEPPFSEDEADHPSKVYSDGGIDSDIEGGFDEISLQSEDDLLFADEEDLLDDPEFEDNYGEFLDELSDPEDYLSIESEEFDSLFKTGRGLHSDPDSDPDSDPESDPDSEPETEPDSDPDSDPSSDPYSDPESDMDKKEGFSSDVTPVSSHPIYGRYFRMLRSGLSKELVAMQVAEDGLNPKILDLQPSQPVSPEFLSISALQKKSHKHSIATNNQRNHQRQMQQSNTDELTLEDEIELSNDNSSRIVATNNPVYPNVAEPPNEVDTMVPAIEHPIYSKYLKMLKVGIPRNIVEQKLMQEGIDPAVAFLDHHALVSTKERRAYIPADTSANLKEPRDRNSKKKKLYITGVDHSQIGADSLWAAEEADGELNLDREEFNRLFVEIKAPQQQKGRRFSSAARASIIATRIIGKKVTLINFNRAQNAAIALSRISLPNDQILINIRRLVSEPFTSDQLRSLAEFLPTRQEAEALASYEGDPSLLGKAEQYMLAMLALPDAKIRLDAMLFKHHFLSRWHSCKHSLGLVESACDHIKMSSRLKKVLRTILKVVNELQDGEVHKGIAVSSLVKLSTSKAFDQKTSVLQYIVMLIHRNDSDALSFPSDLLHLSEAARLSLSATYTECTAIKAELEMQVRSLHRLVTDISDSIEDEVEAENLKKILQDFELRLYPLCTQLATRYEILKNKFANILSYFGEAPNLVWDDFILHLNAFVQDFINSRDQFLKHEAKKRSKATHAK